MRSPSPTFWLTLSWAACALAVLTSQGGDRPAISLSYYTRLAGRQERTQDSLLIADREWALLIGECEENVGAVGLWRGGREERKRGKRFENAIMSDFAGAKKQPWNVPSCFKFGSSLKGKTVEDTPQQLGNLSITNLDVPFVFCVCMWCPTWVKVPLMVLWRGHQYHQDCDNSNRQQLQGWQGHDSSSTPGYLSGDTLMTTGIPVAERRKKDIKVNLCRL